MALPWKSVAHRWQVLRTRCTGPFRTISLPVTREVMVRGLLRDDVFIRERSTAIIGGIATGWPLTSGSLDFLAGNLGHFLQRVCWQKMQIFSAPKVV